MTSQNDNSGKVVACVRMKREGTLLHRGPDYDLHGHAPEVCKVQAGDILVVYRGRT